MLPEGWDGMDGAGMGVGWGGAVGGRGGFSSLTPGARAIQTDSTERFNEIQFATLSRFLGVGLRPTRPDGLPDELENALQKPSNPHFFRLPAGVKRTTAGGSLVAPFTKLPLRLLYFFTKPY